MSLKIGRATVQHFLAKILQDRAFCKALKKRSVRMRWE
jgi:hypothetical protein